jgi:hypothetical protein
MLSVLRRLLGGDRLVRLARGPDRRAFATAFCRAKLWFLEVPDRPGVTLDGRSDDDAREALLKDIEAAASALSRAESFRPHVLDTDAGPVLPLFTSEREGRAYLQVLMQGATEARTVYLLGTTGADIAPTLGGYAAVSLNPAGDRHTFGGADFGLIRAAAGG